MPIILRATDDMIIMSSFVDVMINPVNCRGVAGKGLALAFREYCPEQYEEYRQMCIDQRLVMGTLHIYYNKKDNTIIVNAPTKNHWIDSSNLADVELTVAKIAEYLVQHPFYTVALPMLGTGEGKLDHRNVLNLFYKYLDHLPNIIFVCMRPAMLTHQPKYLAIGGSREYSDYDRIELGIVDALCAFGLSYPDFAAMVSGGASGVDMIACGSGKAEAYDPAKNIAKHHGIKPIVVAADWERYGKSAGYVRNRLMLEIGTHFVLFIGSRSVGTKNMKDLIERHNKKANAEQAVLEDIFQRDPSRTQGVFPALPPVECAKYLYVHDISGISL